MKRKLAAVTYFKYYSPNRVIIREGHQAQALYFIASGEVTVTQTTLDGVLQQNYEAEVSCLGPGDMFGEASLIHNIPMETTCTTKGLIMFGNLSHFTPRSILFCWIDYCTEKAW